MLWIGLHPANMQMRSEGKKVGEERERNGFFPFSTVHLLDFVTARRRRSEMIRSVSALKPGASAEEDEQL